MKPTSSGIYEWFDHTGKKRLVEVVDVSRGMLPPYLRVYFNGSYYNVHDEHDPECPQFDHLTKAEWADKWGSRIANNFELPDAQLYLAPDKSTEV